MADQGMRSGRRKDQPERGPVVGTEEVRQGETSGHVRVVLSVSLFLALVAFVILYALYV